MIKYIILALVQGLTEFLPVSSSGHLVIFSRFLGTGTDILLYLVLHLGTIFSLIIFFFKDIIEAVKKLEVLKKIILVTFITAALGFLGKDFFRALFSNYNLVLSALFINGLILIFANQQIKKTSKEKPTYLDSLILGFTQAVAIIPGISRSGMTISTLLFRKVNREQAFGFSFLAAIPIIIAAFVFELISLGSAPFSLPGGYYITGFFVSLLTGYFSLFILKSIIKSSRLDIFGYYCVIIALANLIR